MNDNLSRSCTSTTKKWKNDVRCRQNKSRCVYKTQKAQKTLETKKTWIPNGDDCLSRSRILDKNQIQDSKHNWRSALAQHFGQGCGLLGASGWSTPTRQAKAKSNVKVKQEFGYDPVF